MEGAARFRRIQESTLVGARSPGLGATIDVRTHRRNVTSYAGDEKFLVGRSAPGQWEKLQPISRTKKGVLSPCKHRQMLAHGPAIDRDAG
jgi:hypothetical protein